MVHLFKDVVEEMIQVKALFFSLYIDTNSMSTPLEIPAAFMKKTRWPGTSDCSLVTLVTSMKQWLVMLMRRSAETVVSVDKGWSDFLRDQEIQVGNFLVFEVVNDCCLAVTVYPPQNCTKFKKILKATYARSLNSARLDIPTAFWREVGDGISYTLRGPSSEVVVKSCRHVSKTQTFCFFATGWCEYYTANDLKEGDTLVFSLIDSTTFHVTKLQA
ncbi:hypothetical protein M758_UG262100 [Ceratodon purpureus]|nr:hypothetical protein M758_UG262100 [Ceratodon purpureus]